MIYGLDTLHLFYTFVITLINFVFLNPVQITRLHVEVHHQYFGPEGDEIKLAEIHYKSVATVGLPLSSEHLVTVC